MLAYLTFPPWLRPEIIPGLPLRWYGLMYLVAFAVAYAIVQLQVRERRLEVSRDDVLNLFFWGIVGLLVGARLFAVTIYDPSGYYLSHPLQIIVPVASAGGRLIPAGCRPHRRPESESCTTPGLNSIWRPCATAGTPS